MLRQSAISAVAVSATLMLGACASYPERDALDFGTRLAADLDGGNAVGSAGDPDGTGDFLAALSAGGRMCYQMEAQGTALITAAHIHEGTAEVAGGVVAPLITPQMGQRANACTQDMIARKTSPRGSSHIERFIPTYNPQELSLAPTKSSAQRPIQYSVMAISRYGNLSGTEHCTCLFKRTIIFAIGTFLNST